ncbi:hypothetical protein HY768_06110 [candidate division TA06 bacterium]|uniref:Uncharacterized protein n=1 Tax=candidate division TA06 bacterium TaxID=2250710 RepID=A0A933MI63_UNCT6|nr:hypothetical protein [candidate division TA06 bacterium]
MADYNYTMFIIDVSNPLNPTITGYCDTGGNAYDVAIFGGYAYVSTRQSGLRIMTLLIPQTQ